MVNAPPAPCERSPQELVSGQDMALVSKRNPRIHSPKKGARKSGGLHPLLLLGSLGGPNEMSSPNSQ